MIFNGIAKIEGLRAFSPFKTGLTSAYSAVLSLWSGPELSAADKTQIINQYKLASLDISSAWGSTYMQSSGRQELVRVTNADSSKFIQAGSLGSIIDMSVSPISIKNIGTIQSFTLMLAKQTFSAYTSAASNECSAIISGSVGLLGSGQGVEVSKLTVLSLTDSIAVNRINLAFNLPANFVDQNMGGT